MHSARARRATALGATTVAALLAAGATALPAQAAASQLELFLPSSMQLPLQAPANPSSDASSALPVNIGRTGTGTLHDVKVSFDTSALTGIADFHSGVSGSGCAASGPVYTCDAHDLSLDRINLAQNIWLTAAAGVKPGTSAVLHVTESSPDAPSVSQDVKVTVGGPQLAVKNLAQITHTKPGSALADTFEVANQGTAPTTKVVVEIEAGQGLTLDKRAANCEYSGVAAVTDTAPGGPQFNNRPSATEAICTVDAVIAPGEVDKLDPIQLGIAKDAYASMLDVAAFPSEDAPGSTAAQWRAAGRFVAGTDDPMRATRTSDPALLSTPWNSNANRFYNEVTTDNTADFAVQAGWAPQGDAKQGVMTVQLLNNGPASLIFGGSGEDAADIRVLLPQGTTVGKLPRGCSVHDPAKPLGLFCKTSYMIVNGTKLTYDFPLTIADPAAAAKAQIDLITPYDFDTPGPYKLEFDPDLADNTTGIALGTQPVNLPSTAAQAGATAPAGTTPAGTTTAPSENSTNPADTKAADSGSALAFTGGGSDALPLTAVGGAALLAGAGALFYARRRRAVARR